MFAIVIVLGILISMCCSAIYSVLLLFSPSKERRAVLVGASVLLVFLILGMVSTLLILSLGGSNVHS